MIISDLLSWLFLTFFAFLVFYFAQGFLGVLRSKISLKKKEIEMEKFRQRDEKLFPLRIQACERMVLFLERIRPAALVSRHLDTCFSKQQLHLRLLQNVRDEFEHNLSQQLFVSDRVWQTVKTAREELTQHINVSFASMEEAITVSAAAQQFLQIDTALLDRAIKMIKEEMTQ